jgi:Rrf2 family protein
MRMSEGVEWVLHCCTVLATLPSDETLPAAKLAELHDVAPAYLAKHLQATAAAGITETVPGPRGGYRLARPPAEISILDVVQAVVTHRLELAAAARLPFISSGMTLYFQFLVLMLAGWVNRHQQSVIEYLQAENPALREQLGPKRIRWADEQRRLLEQR